MVLALQFRKDINGLRAIAVIAVVLFHFNPKWVPGGFAGVDVFFVISGFLMTGIIFRGIEKENFSLARFYVARANRIIPALAALCVTLLVFGWFYLLPPDYETLGRHVSSSIVFYSNFTFWGESGYFDADSREKWLLHTWSLSAEWQFYVLYPIVLVVIKKFFPIKTMKAIILTGTILGFLFCIIATDRRPSLAYFLLPARAWEMMIGGLVYLYPLKLSERNSKVFELVGLVFITLSYFLISEDNPWPGYLALFPVLGACLLIHAQRNDSWVTGNVIFQLLGKWSYSIYLWHWPLVVAIYYFSLPEQYVFIGILLSILLGFISFKYIEGTKYKSDFENFSQYLKFIPFYCVLIVGLFGVFSIATNGASDRYELSNEDRRLIESIKMPLRTNGYCFYSFNDGQQEVSEKIGTDCYLGKSSGESTTLLFGDSYAGHYEPFLNDVFEKNEQSFQSITTNYCIASFNDNYTGLTSHIAYEQCLINRQYLKDNLGKYKNIIFAGSWDSALAKDQLDDFKLVVEKAANLGINVFIIAAPHRYSKNPLIDFYRSLYFNREYFISIPDDADKKVRFANAQLNDFSKRFENVYFFERELLFNDSDTFSVNGVNVPYSLDGGHLSVLGSKQAAKKFMGDQRYDKIMTNFSF